MDNLEYKPYRKLSEDLKVKINQDILFSLSRYYFEHNRFECEEDEELVYEFFDLLYRDFDYFKRNMDDFRFIEKHFSKYKDKLRYISSLVSYYKIELTPMGIKSLDYICQQSINEGNTFFSLTYHKERLYKIGDRINKLLLTTDSKNKLVELITLESELNSVLKIDQLIQAQSNYSNQLSIEIKKLEKLHQFGLLPDEEPSTFTENVQIVEPTKNKDFTTKRQVLAMYYLLNEVGCKTGSVDRTVQGRFIEFLTGKNYDRIYKTLSEPFKGLEITKNTSAKQDMQYIKDQFNNLGLNEIVNKITRDMNI